MPARKRPQNCAAFTHGSSVWTVVTDNPPERSTAMRDGPRRLPLIALGPLGALIVLILAGTYVYRIGESLFGFGESPAERVSLMASDLPPGMTQCTSSGRTEGKGGDAEPYGAADVWTTVWADGAKACNVPPSGRHAFSWVVAFVSETAAVAGYKAFVGAQDCTFAHGCVDWGLGQNLNISCGTPQGSSQSGTGACLATWQRNAFVLTFVGSMVEQAKNAVLNMDARAQQIPAPSRY